MSTPKSLIAAARRRIRRRNIMRAMFVASMVGIGVAALVLGISRLWWPTAVIPPWTVALPFAVAGPLVGAVIGWFRPVLGERELALLVDRALGTDEVLVTLLHLEEQGKADGAVQQDLEKRVAELPSVSSGLRAGPPRYSWAVPIAAVLAALLLLVPQRPGAVAAEKDTDASAMEDEAERLEEAIEELEEELAEALPKELQDELDQLRQDLQDERLTEEEAQERIEKLQEQLADWEEQLEQGANEDEQALQDAADALRENQTEGDTKDALEQLADSLEKKDTEGASEAVKDLVEQLDGASPSEQKQIGEALERAGEAMKGAGNQDLKDLGEGIKQAGQELQDGASAEPGEDGQPSKSARERLEDLAKQLGDSEGLSKRLKDDKDKLKKSQELNGALEGAKQRMGGEPGVPKGQGQGAGQGASEAGTGLDAGMGQGQGKTNAGDGHTWEDEGTRDTVGGHQDADRNGDRTPDDVLDDFESFYDPVRMDGTDSLITKVEGQIDESGHIDSLPTRRTDGDEKASVPLLDVPDRYVDAADEALANERVPPGYRSAVKDYFDTME